MEKHMEHRIILEERRKLEITGVVEVESFDENEILLKTQENVLKIVGNGLKIGVLSVEGGELEVEGEVESLEYEDGKPAKSGFFGRFFP